MVMFPHSSCLPSRRFRGGFSAETGFDIEFDVLNKPFANLREGRLSDTPHIQQKISLMRENRDSLSSFRTPQQRSAGIGTMSGNWILEIGYSNF